MGLIYVNPEGPNGNPDPIASAKDIRETFARMAMNDEETVALIAGGHTFGKCHGASDASKHVGVEPEGGSLEEQGFGWKNSFESGRGAHTITSGLEGAWTTEPAKWDNNYFDNLFNYEWELITGAGGAKQWTPKEDSAKKTVPDAHDPNKKHAPMMLTTDLALKECPIYGPISKRFHENPKEFADAFSKAWYKLTSRDMGPTSRCLGPLVPKEPQLWQDPIPEIDHELINEMDIENLKKEIINSKLSISSLVKTAWSAASTYRNTDKRGGANGGRIRLAPQKDWEVNEPEVLNKVLNKLESRNKKVSIADLIVLGGCAAIEEASKKSSHQVKVPFLPGRTDAKLKDTDIESFSVLEAHADGFKNFQKQGIKNKAEELLLEKACLLNLTAPEMTVLIGGMRVLNANTNESPLGVLTENKESLSNDFFINLLDMNTKWEKSAKCDHFYEGKDFKTKEVKWTASAVDLVFGSNSQLRAISEIYASSDSKEKFLNDFINAWNKVMNLDRFDLK
ncbi:UNVERIFIED_CONTAM: hypothetical protein GTU68_013496 [Idotea baltica]|nr:hypothetical protein [Idotea baltica]